MVNDLVPVSSSESCNGRLVEEMMAANDAILVVISGYVPEHMI